MKLSILILSLAFIALPVLAEDWKTTDGTVYENVKVVHVDDDAVTIIYKDGGALVPMFKLPPNLQERFDYDPVKAKVAAEARLKADKENAEALQREIEMADALKRKEQIANAKALSGTNSP